MSDIRTPITLQEFLFTLNQDEDIFVHIIDYMNDERLHSGWKSDLVRQHEYDEWFVQDFTSLEGGLEITIVKLKIELD